MSIAFSCDDQLIRYVILFRLKCIIFANREQMVFKSIQFNRKSLIWIFILSAIILVDGQSDTNSWKEMILLRDSSEHSVNTQNRNTIFNSNSNLIKPIPSTLQEYKRLVHFFILGFSFLMAITFFVKAIINNWDRSYIYCFMMFLATLISILLWEKIITWSFIKGSRFNPGLVGLWLNQSIPIFLLLLYREFLDLKQDRPTLYKTISIVACLLLFLNCGLLISRNSFIGRLPFDKLFEWSLLLTILHLCTRFIIYNKDSVKRYAFWSTLAVLFSFGTYLLLNTFGIKTIFYDWFENNYLIYLGLITDGLLFLTALSVKEKGVLINKTRLEVEKQQILADQNATLESEVNIRTTELKKSLDQLKSAQSQLIEAEKAAATLRVKQAISNDLHDEVGSTLTSIQLLSDLSLRNKPHDISAAQDQLQKIKQQTSLVQSKIRDIVWASQSENISLQSLKAKMSEIAAGMLEPINFEFELKDSISTNDLTLSSEKCKNILMIFREALNNIIKHAHAKKVTVNWEQNQNRIELNIADDGNGKIDYNTSGSGLRIMKERVENIGGQLKINGNNTGSYLAISFATDSFTTEYTRYKP